MKNLNDKVVVITGAGSGIGRSLALKMYKLGAKLALNDLKKNALDETLSMIDNPENIYTETFDVSVKKDFDLFAKNVINHFKKVDVLINNAGITVGSYSVCETSIEKYEKVIGINSVSYTHLTLPTKA